MPDRIISNSIALLKARRGATGAVFTLDLSNDMDSVPCDNNGRIVVATNVYSQIMVFYGSENITAACQVKYTAKPTNASVYLETSASGTSGTTSLTTTFQTIGTKKYIRLNFAQNVTVASREVLSISIKHDLYGTLDFDMVIVGLAGGATYHLVPSNNVVSKNKTGTYNPASITCDVKKIDAVSGAVTTNPTGATIKYIIDDGSTEHTYSTSLIAGTDFEDYITFLLYVNGVIVDRETVSIVEDGLDGVSVLSQYAPNNNPSSSQIHGTWQSGDLYMRTKSTTDSNWSSWHKIVGESGDETDYSFNISKSKTSTNSTTAPSDCYYTNWQDAPIAPTSTYPYMWMKIVKKTWNESTQSYDSGTPSYARVTGEKGDGGVNYCFVFTKAAARVDEYNIVTAELAGYAYKYVGGVSSALTSTTIRYGYILTDSETYNDATTNSSGFFDVGAWFNDDDITDYGKNSPSIFAAIVIDGTVVHAEMITISIKGGTGNRGKVGRFFYYAGELNDFASTDSFLVNDAQAPYFHYNNNYWVFNPETNGTYTKQEMGTPSSSSSNWKVMTSDFKYIITEAIFGAYAHFGSFIINGDWLISQHGTINGSASTNYTAFDPNHPNDNTGSNFIPHFAVNGLTGKSYQNDAYIKGQVVATSGEFSGTIRAGSTRIVGNLDLTDTSNGMTVYDSESVPRINLQPKAISTIATLANDTYNYYNLYNTKTGASSFEVTTSEQSFSFAKYENLDIDKFSVTMYSSGSNGTLFPSSYYTYLAILITHPSGDTTTINITTSRVSSYGSFQNLTSKTRFVAPVAGTYKVKITVTNPGSWTSGQTSVYASVSARYQSSKDTQVYIAKDGFYAHAGANKLIWAGETETQIRYGFNGIRWNDADPKGNRSMDVVAGVKGTLPNGKPLWLPFYNFIPTFGVGTGTKPYLFTSQYIYNISETKYAFKIDPYRDRGVCIVYSGYHAYGGNEQESWVVLPPETFTDSDGSTVGLPVGYQITIINWTKTNIYVVPNANSNHGAVIVDAHRDNNWYASLNGSQSRDTYIYVGSRAGLGVVWLAMHDTQ